MTATLAPPEPPRVPGPARSRAANRAIARWARRMVRREWRQQLLVISLLVVAVAGTTLGLGLIENVDSGIQAYTGSATTRIDIQNPAPDTSAIEAAAHRRFGTVELIVDAAVPIPGSTALTDLRAEQVNGQFSWPMLRLVSGHYPIGPAQIAATRSVLQTYGLHVGQAWTVLGQSRRVVGIVENPKDFSDSFALVAPGQIAHPNGVSILTDASGGSSVHFRSPSGQVVGVMSTESDGTRKAQQALAVLLIATIGLTFIALLSVAGFTVMAQRRLRSLGMIAAIGATDRQVRKVMLANGTAVGAVGAGGGLVLGVALWFALRPEFENLVGHRIDALSLPWWAVLVGAALAVLASLSASWWPARSAARMPVVAALSGRPPAPQPAHRFALLGIVASAIGFVLLTHHSNNVLVIVAILVTTGGMLLLAPLALQALALLAARLPVAMRLALRDLARYQARSGAAVAAASLAVGIAALIAISTSAQQSHDRAYTVGNLPANQLVVWVDANNATSPKAGNAVAAPGVTGPSGPTAAQIAAARATAAQLSATLGSGAPIELDELTNPQSPGTRLAPGSGIATVVRPITANGQSGFSFVEQPYLATPALLAHYGITARDVHTGTAILTSRTDLSGARLFDGDKPGLDVVKIQVTSALPTYTSAPDTLLMPAEARRLGLGTQPSGFLVQAPHALTSAQVRAARHVAAANGAQVETRNAPDTSPQRLREWATTVGILVALGVLAMTVGLIRSETSGDLRTLAAAGAGASTRRTLTASTAASLGLLGALIGVAGAYLALVAWHWHHVNYLDKPPYLELAAMLAGLPLLAFVGGWLVGRTPAHLARVRSE